MKHKLDAIKTAEAIMVAHRKTGLSELGAYSAAKVTVREILNVITRRNEYHSLYMRTMNYLEYGWKSTLELLDEEIQKEEMKEEADTTVSNWFKLKGEK